MEKVHAWLQSLGFDYVPKWTGKYENFGEGGKSWFLGYQSGNFVYAICGNFKAGSFFRYDEVVPPSEREAHATFLATSKQKSAIEAKLLNEKAAVEVRESFSKLDCGKSTPYTTRKGIQFPEGCKVQGEILVVPMRDIQGTLASLQYIYPNGNKQNWAGGKKQGCFHALGSLTEKTVVVCEGLATAQSIREATGFTVVAAFDCGNLPVVAEAIRKTYDPETFIVAADNDHETKGNPGLTWGKKAGGKLLYPECRGTDFNDLHIEKGLAAVRQVFFPNSPFKLSELFANPPKPCAWLVDTLLPEIGLGLIISKQKIGKSTLVRQLCLDVVRGDMFLGKFKTKQGPAIIYSQEDHRGIIYEHFKRLGATGGEEIYIFDQHINPADALKTIEEWIVRYKPVIVILDTLRRTLRCKDLNDYDDVIETLQPVQNLAKKYELCIVALHHAGKLEKEDEDVALGSSALGATADASLILRRDANKVRYLSTVIRQMGANEETWVLSFDKESGKTLVRGTKQAVVEDSVEKQIIDVLKVMDQPMQTSWIGDEVGGNREKVLSVLQQMRKDGKLKMTTVKGKGRPRQCYALEAGFLATLEAPEF